MSIFDKLYASPDAVLWHVYLAKSNIHTMSHFQTCRLTDTYVLSHNCTKRPMHVRTHTTRWKWPVLWELIAAYLCCWVRAWFSLFPKVSRKDKHYSLFWLNLSHPFCPFQRHTHTHVHSRLISLALFSITYTQPVSLAFYFSNTSAPFFLPSLHIFLHFWPHLFHLCISIPHPSHNSSHSHTPTLSPLIPFPL